MELPSRSLSENIGRRFHLLLEVLARKSTRLLTQHLRRNNLQPRLYEIMAFISETPQNQTTIAETLQINKNVMVRLVDELEKRGLGVRVQKAGLRRREYNIQLTAKGNKSLRDCDKVVAQAEREVLAALTDAEREELGNLLSKSLRSDLNSE
jgi:DNA-binding MarR family transcriptional regulator